MPGHRRLPDRQQDPADALARGPALLDQIEEQAVSCWTRLRRPALVLGRSGRGPRIDQEALRRSGLGVHQRASGGGAVLWDDGLLALDVILPRGHGLLSDDVVVAYRWIGEAVRDGLRDLGVDAHALTPEAARARSAPRGPAVRAACFGGFSPWEVTVDGRKVAGLCQIRRAGGGLLQVGIVRTLDHAGLIGLLGGGSDETAEFSRRTGELEGLTAARITTAVQSRVDEALGPARDDVESDAEQSAIASLARGRFAARPAAGGNVRE